MNKLARRRLGVVGALIATATLFLTGCAGTPSTGPSLDPNNPTKIKVIRSAGGQFEPLMIGIEQGFYKAEGLDVSVEAGTGNPATLPPLLVSGQVQFVMIDVAAPISAVAEGLPISLISVIQNDDPSIAASAGLQVPPGSSIKTVADLKGKTIATNQLGGLPVVATNAALKNAGLAYDSVKWVQLAPDALASAALKGQADAILTFGAFFAGAAQQGFKLVDATTASNTFPKVTQVAWAASNQYIAENKTIVDAFTRANAKAEEYANKNPDAIRAVDTKLTQLPPAYIASRPIQPLGGAFHTDVIQKLADAMVDQGFAKKKIDIKTQLLWSGAKKD